jgi:hypothetical protein
VRSSSCIISFISVVRLRPRISWNLGDLGQGRLCRRASARRWVISFRLAGRRWKAVGIPRDVGIDIWASTSPKRDSMSRSFMEVIAS